MITPFDVTLSYLHLQAVGMLYRSYDGYFLSRVGRQRGTFLPFSVGPSPNPCMHLIAHTALQLMTATQVQVAAHLVPFILSTVTHLSPFPVSRALPRAVEYYGDSVALSLSACRRSRIYPRETYIACRCPFRSLKPTRCRSLAAESLRQSSVPTDSYGVVAPDVLRQV